MCTEKEIYLEKQLNDCRFALSKVSHEIRNPVTLINSTLQLIEKEHPEMKEYSLWKNVMEDMAFLRRLLNDLSSYNNTFRCQPQKTEITSWLSNLANAAPKLFPDKHFCYSVDIPENLPPVYMDTTKMNQALTNLLRNAFEAADSEISFCAYEHLNRLYIKIHNDGTHIPPEQQQDIFRPFITTKTEGTGLGLPIAKGILEAHNGTLSLTSSKTEGTNFLASLPLL